ncbi:MAG: pimeloyl-ACP methyl ester carboxylesterase [Glaciecola sp.]|jgi:pimeloyl-ACP methyl ester carboxylesterase
MIGPWAYRVLVDVAGDVDLHALEWTPEHARCELPDVLLVHGLASNAQLWTGLARLLAQAGHRVIAVDLRGHGLSAKVDDDYTHESIVTDLVAVIDAFAMDRPIAFGQSWGGNLVLELAARHPDRVAGIVCIDGGQIELSSVFDDIEAMKRVLRPPPLAGMALADLERNLRSRMLDWPEEGIRGQLANFARRPDGTITPHLSLSRHLQILHSLWAHHPSEQYETIEVPVMMMPVEGGPSAGVDAKQVAVALAQELLPRSRTQWFAGSHDIHAEDPAGVADVFAQALADDFFGAATQNGPVA